MILEQLREKSSFTTVESSIADYLLGNGLEARRLSIVELARATHSSAASITRLCQKLGVGGYKEFCMLFSSELEGALSRRQVDLDLPFAVDDSFEQVSRNMSALVSQSVDSALRGFDHLQLKRVVNRLAKARVINVFATGIPLIAAQDFKAKVVRLGKQINVEENLAILPAYAFSSDPSTVGLFLSQSGETAEIVDCAKILSGTGAFSVAVTSSTSSSLAGICDEAIATSVGEGDQKIETFASSYAFHFVLDCLYCWLYKTDFEHNQQRAWSNDLVVRELTNR